MNKTVIIIAAVALFLYSQNQESPFTKKIRAWLASKGKSGITIAQDMKVILSMTEEERKVFYTYITRDPHKPAEWDLHLEAQRIIAKYKLFGN